MKNLKAIVVKNQKLIVGLLISSVLLVTPLAFASPGHDDATGESQTSESTPSSQLGTIQETELEKLGISNVSFAGEVLSTDDVRIHPLVEGQLIELNVKIGQYVEKGQVLGRLSVAPNPDLIATLAEKAKNAERSRLQMIVIDKITNENKQLIDQLKTVLDRAKDSAIQIIYAQAEQNLIIAQGASQQLSSQNEVKEAIILSAQADYEQALTAVDSELMNVRTAAQNAYVEFTSIVSDNIGLSTNSTIDDNNFNEAYGKFDQQTRGNFASAVMAFKNAFEDETKLPENEIDVFFDAAGKLLLSSHPSTYVSAEKLEELRQILTENEVDYYEALKNYKDALGELVQKQADYETVKAEQERDIVGLEVDAKNAQSSYEITESLIEAKKVEIETDFEKQKFEYDNQLLELLKEKLLYEAEAQAAEVAYQVFASKIGGQEIVALKSGYVSGVYMNLGDHVTPETAVLAITGDINAKKFVRFKIPADTKLVSVGEVVDIESLNSQFGKTQAIVTGVSLSLDSNGFFLADADLNIDANLPVHANVRIVPNTQNNLLVVPLSALVADENGKYSIWLVDKDTVIHKKELTIGRTFGDQVEILDGVALNDQFIVKPAADLVDGSKWEGTVPTEEAEEPAPEGDGHGHSHD
ncbi:MAG: biotin/lipoyl-binding protein [Patescibacteria group bacterium]